MEKLTAVLGQLFLVDNKMQDTVYLRSKVLGQAGLWLWDRSPLFQGREKLRASIRASEKRRVSNRSTM
ncbi:hypothetical protein ACFQ4L_02035 [Lapidilactobacillus mulanensis]|uniref:Uncharacterized protein n=1 Tax=Lapidilactobacillus mulanensis TaxID=2485999 RepID=A0ABW4DLU4_9LACO